MKYIPLFLLLLIACQFELSEKQFKEKIIAANSNIDYYKRTVIVDMNIEYALDDLQYVVDAQIDGLYLVDNVNNEMFIITDTNTSSSNISIDIRHEMYIIESTIYENFMGNWTRKKLDYDSWNDNDELGYIIDLMSSGTIHRLPDTDSQYVINMDPDLRKLVEYSMEDSPEIEIPRDTNMEDIVRSYSYQVWINKDTYVVEKVMGKVIMRFTPDLLGVGGEWYATTTLYLESHILDVGKPLDITLPTEADEAVYLTESEESVPPITGMSILDVVQS